MFQVVPYNTLIILTILTSPFVFVGTKWAFHSARQLIDKYPKLQGYRLLIEFILLTIALIFIALLSTAGLSDSEY